MISGPLRFLAVPIDSVHPDPANARLHGEKNLATLKASLAQFGQRKPIVVQKDGMIVRAGSGTLRAAQALGWTEIAAVIVDDDNATASQYAIADNRTAELAEWDDEALASLLQGMDEQSRQAVGFDQDDLEALLKSLTPAEPTGDAEPMLGAVQYSVVVDVDGEHAQAELLERLEREGYKCRALMS
jgi:ParB-like chromosome segregation protein Spo0J